MRHSIVDCPFGRLARTLAAFDRPDIVFPQPPEKGYNYELSEPKSRPAKPLQSVDTSRRFLIGFQ